MPADPRTMTDPVSLRVLLENAKRLNRDDIADACRERLYELEGIDHDDPIERRLWQAVAAYEETLREKHGRKQKASYTRRKIASKGAIQTLTDWALDNKVTPGFMALVEGGAARFTGEYVVLEFADKFSQAAVDAAREKLLAYGIRFP
ncbi:hypothetical protein PsAD46_05487 [Pseudovibrio sp. Ad46]|uniref:hypothetical protein n=1 Tax=unclassified Pseudovibrio TaxID=2627060 RepID=UPI0007AE8B1C|nr:MULTISPECIES: hypothetical protein [unclassified Pseudovibrio]KZK75751.1 hypothetical protein PsAD46_05487 [Pseudovibrio sp. Ad46]KZK98148.1 hypothetical protein PsAD5_01789 [Pseudovibrio sp. Ad5]